MPIKYILNIYKNALLRKENRPKLRVNEKISSEIN